MQGRAVHEFADDIGLVAVQDRLEDLGRAERRDPSDGLQFSFEPLEGRGIRRRLKDLDRDAPTVIRQRLVDHALAALAQQPDRLVPAEPHEPLAATGAYSAFTIFTWPVGDADSARIVITERQWERW